MWFTTSTWLNIYWIWNTPHLAPTRPRLFVPKREREILHFWFRFNFGHCHSNTTISFLSAYSQPRWISRRHHSLSRAYRLRGGCGRGERESWRLGCVRRHRMNSCLEKYARATDSIRYCYSQHPIIIVTIIPFIYETWKRFYGVEKIRNRIYTQNIS